MEKTGSRPGIFYGYWVLAACFVCQILNSGFTMYSFSVYVKPVSATFGWNRATLMLASTTMNLVAGIFGPLVGKLVYRVGAKKMITLGAIVSGLGFVLLGFTHAVWQYYAYYALVGMGTAAMGVLPNSMVVSNWFKKRRGFAIGLLGAGIGIGGFSAPLLSGAFLIPRYGWQISYIAYGLITVIVAVPLSLLVIKSRPEDMGLFPDGEANPVAEVKSHGSRAPGAGLDFRGALRTIPFWLTCLGFLTFSFANQSIFQNHSPHLQDIGFPLAVAASAVSFVGIGSAIGKFGFGWLCDFIAAKFALVFGIIFQASALIILMTIKPSSPVALIWLYSLLFGLGVGSWLPAMSMTVSSVFGLGSYGVIFGVVHLVAAIGTSVGPLVAGRIFDVTGSYYQAFILAFCFYAVSLPAISLVSKPKNIK